MRGKWIHAPQETQPCPPDNTGEHVMAQVRTWRAAPTLLIHPEAAMAIAAWWQSPTADDMPYTTFASRGEITDGLAEAIRADIGDVSYEGVDQDREDDRTALRALLAYVQACEVTVWMVTRTDLTAANPERTFFFGSAPGTLGQSVSENVIRQMMRDALMEALDEYFPEDYPASDCGPAGQECESDSGEMCARHSEQASIAAFLQDGGNHYRIDLADVGAAKVLLYAISHWVRMYDE